MAGEAIVLLLSWLHTTTSCLTIQRERGKVTTTEANYTWVSSHQSIKEGGGGENENESPFMILMLLHRRTVIRELDGYCGMSQKILFRIFWGLGVGVGTKNVLS